MLCAVSIAGTGSLKEAPSGCENLGSWGLTIARRADCEETEIPSDPFAVTEGCKLLVPRRVAAMATRSTAYDTLDASLLELLQTLQQGDDFVHKKKAEITSTSKRVTGEVLEWWRDSCPLKKSCKFLALIDTLLLLLSLLF